jgi:Cu-processing system ATP-binding protein
MSQEIAALSGVTRRFGKQVAVSGVDLTLRAGECVGLVGHNGAGKSTMIKMMLGLLRPSEGTVRVLGDDPAASASSRDRGRLGYLPENVALYPSMTGAETLAFYARLKGQPVSLNAALLEKVGIAGAAHRRVGTYSKGMRQRLGLAQALLADPRVLLLDEPTSGLDPALRQHFYEILRDLRGRGAMVLLSTHALAELEGQVDRVVVMNQGRRIADGDLAALRSLAGLRPRIRLRLPRGPRAVVNGADAWAGWTRLNDDVLELSCDESEVARTLRGLPGSARDVEILRPSLDELYASFQKGAL